MRNKLNRTTVLTGVAILMQLGAVSITVRPVDAQDVTVDAGEAYSIAQDTRERLSPVIEQSVDFRIELAGVFRTDGQAIRQKIKGGAQSYSYFDNRRDLAVFGEATTRRGLVYGFEYDIDADRARLHLSSGYYGRVEMGNADTATEALEVRGDDAMVGRGSWSLGGGKGVNTGGISGLGFVSAQNNANSTAGLSADFGFGTVRYTSPNFGGLTVAISYTEETDNDMIDGTNTPTFSEDVLSFAGQLTTSYGNYTTTYYAGFETSNNAALGGALEDQRYASAGYLVRGEGMVFGVAGGWNHNDILSTVTAHHENRYWVDTGLSFSADPWAVAIGGAYLVDELVLLLPDLRVIDTTILALSATFNYRMAPGLALMGGVTHWDIGTGDFSTFADATVDALGKADNKATVFTLSTQMVF